MEWSIGPGDQAIARGGLQSRTAVEGARQVQTSWPQRWPNLPEQPFAPHNLPEFPHFPHHLDPP